MLQPNGLADSHHSFDHRERLWCAATAAPTASTRGRPAGRQQPRVMLLADVEIAGDVEIQPQWRVLPISPSRPRPAESGPLAFARPVYLVLSVYVALS